MLTPSRFPRFSSATCNFFEIWLVHCTVCVLCDWLEWLVWFWFSQSQLKAVLIGIIEQQQISSFKDPFRILRFQWCVKLTFMWHLVLMQKWPVTWKSSLQNVISSFSKGDQWVVSFLKISRAKKLKSNSFTAPYTCSLFCLYRVLFNNFSAFNSVTKRESGKGSDSSASSDVIPHCRREQGGYFQAQTSSSPKRSADVNSKVFGMSTNLESGEVILSWKLVTTELKTMSENLRQLVHQCSVELGEYNLICWMEDEDLQKFVIDHEHDERH